MLPALTVDAFVDEMGLIKNAVSTKWVIEHAARGAHQRGAKGITKELIKDLVENIGGAEAGALRTGQRVAESYGTTVDPKALRRGFHQGALMSLKRHFGTPKFQQGMKKVTTEIPEKGPPSWGKRTAYGLGTAGGIGLGYGGVHYALSRGKGKEKKSAATIPGIAKAKWYGRPWQLLTGSRIKPLQEGAQRSFRSGFGPDINIGRAMEAEAGREIKRARNTRLAAGGLPIAALAGSEATKTSGIPLKLLANPKFAPYFERVAAGGTKAPRLFPGGPPVNIPGISPARKIVQKAPPVVQAVPRV